MKRLAASLMLLAGVFLTVPVDLVHLLAAHADTSDVCFPADKPSVGEEHHHCEILQCSLPPCTHPAVEIHFLFAGAAHEQLSGGLQRASCTFPAPFSIRGPPPARFS